MPASTPNQYVALVQQGMLLDQQVAGIGPDQQKLQADAHALAAKLNAEQTGFGEGYTAVVLKCPA